MVRAKKGAERRAVVEQMRKEQQRKERTRGLLVVGVAVAIGAVIIGFAVVQVLKSNERDSRDLASIGTSASACQAVETKAAVGSADHRPENVSIAYPDAPPADGPHWANYLQPTEIRKYYTADDRPPVERLVHSLEHGNTILWYDESIAADSEQLADIRSIAKKFPSATDANDKFIAAPWLSDDGVAFPKDAHVALTHWSMGGTNGNDEGQLGVWQYCATVSGDAVETFMSDYPFSDSPEPTAP